MKRPAVFFDRDNTLVTCDEYLGDASKVALVAGAAEAVARARKLGYATVVISNQSGVARGYFSEAAVHAVNSRLDEMLADENAKAVIDRHEFCPFHPDASIEKYRTDSSMRKPSPGMLLSAADALALDLPRSWMVGDAPRDIEAGHAAGCRTILFVDPALKRSPAALAEKTIEPDYVCSTLKEAMDFVEKNTETETTGEGETMKDEAEKAGPTVPSSTLDVQPSANENVEHRSSNTQLRTEEIAPAPSAAPSSTARLESLSEQILYEMRRRHEQPQADFSVSKLMAGVVQVIVLFVLFMSYLNRADMGGLLAMLMFALTLQAMTIALLIMGKQR